MRGQWSNDEGKQHNEYAPPPIISFTTIQQCRNTETEDNVWVLIKGSKGPPLDVRTESGSAKTIPLGVQARIKILIVYPQRGCIGVLLAIALDVIM